MSGVSLTWRPGVALDPSAAPQRRAKAVDGAALVEQDRSLHAERLGPEGGLLGCLACGHPELYTQRDFPRPLGIGIVVVAAVLAPATHYVSLGLAALLDFVLYHAAGRVVVCYVCRAGHRGFPEHPKHPAFDREIEERLLYGKKAVMGKPMRAGGTADAPEPEH